MSLDCNKTKLFLRGLSVAFKAKPQPLPWLLLMANTGEVGPLETTVAFQVMAVLHQLL